MCVSPSRAVSSSCPPESRGAEPRILSGSSMWCGILSEMLGAGRADLGDHVRQNLARQHATNFGRRGATDGSRHHLIQTESLLVTTPLDLVRPRDDAANPTSSVKPGAEPRGFFADQFEAGGFPPRLFFPLCPARGFSVEPFTSYGWNVSVLSNQTGQSDSPLFSPPATTHRAFGLCRPRTFLTSTHYGLFARTAWPLSSLI